MSMREGRELSWRCERGWGQVENDNHFSFFAFFVICCCAPSTKAQQQNKKKQKERKGKERKKQKQAKKKTKKEKKSRLNSDNTKLGKFGIPPMDCRTGTLRRFPQASIDSLTCCFPFFHLKSIAFVFLSLFCFVLFCFKATNKDACQARRKPGCVHHAGSGCHWVHH